MKDILWCLLCFPCFAFASGSWCEYGEVLEIDTETLATKSFSDAGQSILIKKKKDEVHMTAFADDVDPGIQEMKILAELKDGDRTIYVVKSSSLLLFLIENRRNNTIVDMSIGPVNKTAYIGSMKCISEKEKEKDRKRGQIYFQSKPLAN
jgi:hypothetical protein